MKTLEKCLLNNFFKYLVQEKKFLIALKAGYFQ